MNSHSFNLFRALPAPIAAVRSLANYLTVAIGLGIAFIATAAASTVTATSSFPSAYQAQRRDKPLALASALTKKTSAHGNVTARKRAAVPVKRRVTVATRRRASYQARLQRANLRKVTFTPARPPFGRAFALPDAPNALALSSSVAYVIDQHTNEPLFDKNSQAVLPIASISKLMTAMVVLDAALPLDEKLEITDEDRDTAKNTHSRLTVGSQLSREDMLHIALMASENRAAAALSRYYPGGRPAFVAAMNEKARMLGMTDTHFADPTGLTSLNVSSARDLAKMVNAAYQYPLIREFSTDERYNVFTGKKTIRYNSSNALVHNLTWDIGLQKTGFINEAGECLVMQARVWDRPVIIVLLAAIGKYSRFGDAQRIRKWLGHGGMQSLTSVNAG